MERVLLAIDGGTTNTRVRVWKGSEMIGQASVRIGAKSVAETGSPETWKKAIKEAIQTALLYTGIEEQAIGYAVASGALTSDIGVHFIPHVEGPATMEKFASQAQVVTDPAIAPCPVVFCTGFRNPVVSVTGLSSPELGFMRGEESETFGILESLGINTEAILVLPGSHTKFVQVGPQREIISCISTMAGELVEAVAVHTTLNRSIQYPPFIEFDEAACLEGAILANSVGLPQVCFSIRAVDLFGEMTADQRGNLLTGAVVAEDIRSLKHLFARPLEQGCPILVSGNRPLRKAFTAVLRADSHLASKVVYLDDEIVDRAPNMGALAIAQLALEKRTDSG